MHAELTGGARQRVAQLKACVEDETYIAGPAGKDRDTNQVAAKVVVGNGVARPTRARDCQREAAVVPDRVQRRFEAAKPNQVWVADITYVPTQEGFLYLATVLDVFSRKVVGWAMSARQTVELVQSALEMALETWAARGVVFHSDRGCQYTTLAFSQRCAEAGIQRSMGRVGSCFDKDYSSYCTSFERSAGTPGVCMSGEALLALFCGFGGSSGHSYRHSPLSLQTCAVSSSQSRHFLTVPVVTPSRSAISLRSSNPRARSRSQRGLRP